jgi:hypothetical protein
MHLRSKPLHRRHTSGSHRRSRESGKTTTLEVLRELLGDRCIGGTSVTPSVVFRVRDKRGPVAILLDEIDNTLRDRKDDGARELLALVNGRLPPLRQGMAGASARRTNHGSSWHWGPAAIAGLGALHPTTESRCIPIVLERKDKGSGEAVAPSLVGRRHRTGSRHARDLGDP